MPAEPVEHRAERPVGARLPGGVSQLREDHQGLPVVPRRLVHPAQPGQHPGEVTVGVRLPGSVAGPLRPGQGVALRHGQVRPPPPALQEVHQCPGQLPRVAVEPGPPRVGDRREQHRILDAEPGERLTEVGDLLGQHTRRGGGEGDRVPSRLQQQCRRVGGVQVVVQPAPDRGPPSLLRFETFDLLGRVRPEQVVRAEPAGGVLGDEVRVGQFGQQSGHRARGSPARLAAAATPMSGPGGSRRAGTGGPPPGSGSGTTRRRRPARRCRRPLRRTSRVVAAPPAVRRARAASGNVGFSALSRRARPAPAAAAHTAR